jgi:cell division protease FtsH
MGGRASEEIVFGKVSTGALNDLEKVTKQAYAMVVYYGLNKEIGNVSYYDSSGQQEYSFNKPFSEATAQIIDVEIKKMIETGYERAKVLLLENQDKLTQLADILLKKEVIFREDLELIFGRRPFDEQASESFQNGSNDTTIPIVAQGDTSVPETKPEEEPVTGAVDESPKQA